MSPLNQFQQNTAVIQKLDFSDGTSDRLKALGVFEGQTIEVARRGNPLIVKAAGSRIAIADGLAKHILVRELG